MKKIYDNRCEIKPGDFVDWIYRTSRQLVSENEEIWSSTMMSFVPVGKSIIHIVVDIDDNEITWINGKGLFSSKIDSISKFDYHVVPVKIDL